MAAFKQIAYAAVNAASNTSLTSIVAVPPEFSDFAIRIPAAMFVTATCGVNILVEDANTTSTFVPVYRMDTDLTTLTTASLKSQWQTPRLVALAGGYVICDPLRFSPGFVKFQFTATATANTGITIYGRVGY